MKSSADVTAVDDNILRVLVYWYSKTPEPQIRQPTRGS